MKSIILYLFLFLPFLALAENHTLNGQFSDHKSEKVFIAEVIGDKANVIDSTLSNSEGNFVFNLVDSYTVGMYRIFTKKGGFIDLIYNNENINFKSTAANPSDNVQIIESFENKIYFDYLARSNYDQFRLELLQPIVAYYPYNDPFSPELKKQFINIQQGLDEHIQSIISNYSDSFVAKLLRIDRKPLIDPSMSPAMQKVYLKQHFFDNKSFNDPVLLRSTAYSSAIISYLSLFQDNKLNKDDLESEFMIAVDSIMANSNQDFRVNEFVAEYLINGFDQFGFYKVMTHVAELMIIDESCENLELEQRIETLKKLVAGKPAPNIISSLLNGKDFDLQTISKKYTLILFWSSDCPHCSALLPELHEFYLQYKQQLEIVAVSIDTSPEKLKNYLADFNFEWIMLSDYKGWDGNAPLDYGIFTTPNMFLLDANKNIVSHPATIIDILNELK